MPAVFLLKGVDKYPERVYNINTLRGYNRKEAIMEKQCCCERHTVRGEEQKKSLLNRLKRIEGQIRGLQSMVERDAYCNDILIQSAAVGAAVNAFNREILANHIRSCVVKDIRDGKDEIIDELTATIQKLMK